MTQDTETTGICFVGDQYHAELMQDGQIVITTLWDEQEHPVGPEDSDQLSQELSAAIDQVCARFIPAADDDEG